MTALRRALARLNEETLHRLAAGLVGRRAVAALLVVLAMATASGRGWAAAPPAGGARTSSGARTGTDPLAPRISVLTFGPGDPTFSKFGHNAIRVENPRVRGRERDLVYNYGTFRFDSPFLILDFLMGRFRYWLSVSTMADTLATYRARNRSVGEQELALTPEQARQLDAFLRHNALPQNREYLYDYYRDNCSTRVRDAVDRVLGGALSRQLSETPARLTFREHTLRLTAEDLPLYFGLDIAMNDHIDQPVTVWEESFLPGVLAGALEGVRVPRGGREIPLVTRQRTLFRADRKPPPADPPHFLPYFLIAGVAVGGGLVGLSAGARRVGGLRVLLSVLTGALGLAAGILGLLFLGLWLGTNHDVAYHNENLLLCAPWALALVASAPGLARGRPRAAARARRVALSLAAAALLALAIKVFPFADQDNSRILALLVPTWLGLAAGLTLLGRRHS